MNQDKTIIVDASDTNPTKLSIDFDSGFMKDAAGTNLSTDRLG